MSKEEQIMIDGVDVRKCESYNPLGNYNCGGCRRCEERPNCSFKQLARKTQEYDNLSDLLRATDIYTRVCMSCADEILIYPSTSGRTSYTDNEVDVITLKRIINTLRNKSQECEKLKEKFKKFFNIDNQECWDIAFLKDENARYRRALNDIGKIVIQDRNIKDVCLISTCLDAGRVAYDIQQQIIDIINKAKGRGDD